MDDDSSDYDLFVTEFPKKGYKLVDYIQGRVHFALLDQLKIMHTSGMTSNEIKTTIIANITEIIDRFEPEKESESS